MNEWCYSIELTVHFKSIFPLLGSFPAQRHFSLSILALCLTQWCKNGEIVHRWEPQRAAFNTPNQHLSCFPLMFCAVNLNNVWVCVGSVTYKEHGRVPGIDVFSPPQRWTVDDSLSFRVSVLTCMYYLCACVCEVAFECRNLQWV